MEATLETDDKSRKSRKRKRGLDSIVGDADKEIDWLALAPRSINVAEFAETRAVEINTMMKSMCSTSGGRQVFQTLPRHMRRRAMSHNIKRLPRRLRKGAAMEVKKHKRAAKKQDGSTGKKSRRHRRRPQNLLSEYERRKRKHVWLETHIWHAKRFHMIEKWGYKIPHYPNEKSVRAAYRALANHCLIQDISYYGVIEMTGPQGVLLTALGHLTSSETGLTFASASYLNGRRHGTVMLYKSDQYPHGCIAPVNLLWKPLHGESTNGSSAGASTNGTEAREEKFTSSDVRQLWIWCHPSSYEEVLDEINSVCDAVPRKKKKKEKRLKTEDEKTVSDEQGETDDAESDVLAQRSYRNKTSGVRVNALKDNLLRFRLQGPLSQSVLHDVLKPADFSGEGTEHRDSEEDEVEHQPKWWETYYQSQTQKEVHEKQREVWNLLTGVRRADELPASCVMSVTVRDPRLLLPQKRAKVMTAAKNKSDPNPQDRVELSTNLPVHASHSPIWEHSVRKKVSQDKLSVDQLNRRRSQQLIPGSDPQLGREESRIPVLLLQNPGCRQSDQERASSQSTQNHLGLGSGWDVVLPGDWGMAFWVALVYRGARAGGERESQSASEQQALPHFPYAYPDTRACDEASVERERLCEEKYGRYPPDKRPNFTKLGTATPFHCPWDRLVNDWKTSDTQSVADKGKRKKVEKTDTAFFVVRSRTQLNCLARLCQASRDDARKAADSTSQTLSHTMQHCQNALICVKLRMIHRGVATAFAMVCLPTKEDLQKLGQNPKYGGPTEPPHKDPQHALKKLEKKCKKKKNKTELDKRVTETLKSQVEACSDGVTSVRNTSSRQIFGYVCEGSHTFSTGAGCAIGYCTLPGLSQLLKEKHVNKHARVLVRNTNSDQYRFAYLNIVTNFW